MKDLKKIKQDYSKIDLTPLIEVIEAEHLRRIDDVYGDSSYQLEYDILITDFIESVFYGSDYHQKMKEYKNFA